MENLKFCKDCKFYDLYYPRLNLARCRHKYRESEISLISGEVIEYNNLTPTTARYTDSFCGQEAKWFEPKPIAIVIPWYKKVLAWLVTKWYGIE